MAGKLTFETQDNMKMTEQSYSLPQKKMLLTYSA